MSIETNKAVATCHLIDVLEQGHVELIDSYYAPDGSVPDMDTPEQWKDRVLWHHQHCPGFKITILDMMAEGDKVIGHWQADLTYSVPEDPINPFSYPFGKPVTWRIANDFCIVDGKLVSQQNVSIYLDMLVKEDVIPLEKIKNNKAAVTKFVDALNNQDCSLLNEVCSPEIAKEWCDSFPSMYTTMKDHHIEIVDMVADKNSVALKMATSGYHTGVMHDLAPTGNHWTNRVYTFFRLVNGKIVEVDPLSDAENIIKQLGGSIQPNPA